MQKVLKTKVNKKALLGRYLAIFIPIGIAAAVAICFFAPRSSTVFFGGLVAFCLLLSLFLVVSTNGSTEVKCLSGDEVRGPRMYVAVKGHTYEIFQIEKGDIMIRQTARQKAADRGDMTLRDEHIHVTDMENISAVCEFLETYFPHALEMKTK